MCAKVLRSPTSTYALVKPRLQLTGYGNLISLIKWEIIQVLAMLVLLYDCTTWILTKCLEKKLDRNYTRMLHAFSTNSGKGTLQKSSCTAIYLLSCKPSKISEPDLLGTAGVVKTNS